MATKTAHFRQASVTQSVVTVSYTYNLQKLTWHNNANINFKS